MILAATLAHAHRWRHFTQLNLCRPYLRNPFDDFTAAHTDDAMSSNGFGCNSCSRSQVAPFYITKLVSVHPSQTCVVHISATPLTISPPLSQVTLHLMAMSSNGFGCDSCSRSQVAPLYITKLVSVHPSQTCVVHISATP